MTIGGAYRHLPAVEPGAPLALHGLAVEDGAIVLAALPGLAVPVDIGASGLLAGPAGAAADSGGAVYLSDPDSDRILVLGPCDTVPETLGCVRAGSDPGAVRAPGGLAVDRRGILYVADRGNHRVQGLDPRTGQGVAVLGQEHAYDAPRPGDPPGGLREPADVAVDSEDRLYVADRGNGRVVRLGLPHGAVDAGFEATLQAQSHAPMDPTHVAVAVLAGAERLIVLDGASKALVYDLDGVQDDTLTNALGGALAASLAVAGGMASGLAVADGRILVGDPTGRRVMAFDEVGRFAGTVPGFRGPATALALDGRGRLVIATGGGAVRLDAAGRAAAGTFVLGPLGGEGEAEWHGVRALCDPLAENTHLRLYTFTADDAGAALPAIVDWQAAPADQLNLRVLAPAGRYLWIGGALSGAGDATPAVRALRVSWDHEGWRRWLPAVYGRNESAGALDGLLSLLESGLDEQEETIAALPTRFDPGAAPDGEHAGRWLDWLAGWQALELDARWSEADRRRSVGRAFAAHGRRGTPRGLREAIRSSLGIRARIDEPAVAAELWRLGDARTPLGILSMLAGAEADGAVLGRTATLGRSQLIEAGNEGAPLFADLAHRFCVAVHAGELTTSSARDALVGLVDRERPAHTAWALRVIEPRGRVGLQSRVGLDAIVARQGDPLALGAGGGLGEAALAGAPTPGRVGDHAHLGVDATVS